MDERKVFTKGEALQQGSRLYVDTQVLYEGSSSDIPPTTEKGTEVMMLLVDTDKIVTSSFVERYVFARDSDYRRAVNSEIFWASSLARREPAKKN
jgi:hypothetical protein